MTNIARNEISLDDATLTHLLGYLSAKQWVDALKNAKGKAPWTALIWYLIEQQDEAWGGHMKDEVKELLGIEA
jgi:hypothetical protein